MPADPTLHQISLAAADLETLAALFARRLDGDPQAIERLAFTPEADDVPASQAQLRRAIASPDRIAGRISVARDNAHRMGSPK